MAPPPLPAPTSSCGNFFPKDLVGAFAPSPVQAGAYSHSQANIGAYSSAPANTLYSGQAQVTSQNFVPTSTLPHDLGGSSAGSLPEIGDRSI
jgi:hypothetical protein